MPKKNLTDRGLRALKAAPAGTRYEIMDAGTPGLGIRVTDKGHRTFIFAHRFPGGRSYTRRELGEHGAITLEAAREKARHWRELIRRGVDPRVVEEQEQREQQRRRKNTFASVAEEFIKDKLAGERKGREVERDIRREFIEPWAIRSITDITPADVRDVIKAVKDLGAPYQAHNLLGYARRLFNWAIAQEAYGLESSPCDRLKPKVLIGKKALRKRILTDSELRAFWKATEAMGYPLGPLFRLLAVTIQRKSEVAEATWSEFDLDQKLWTIPSERMKGDAAHAVPLSNDALAILRSLPRFNKGGHLFSTTFGVKPVAGFSKSKNRLDQLMLVELRKAAEASGYDPVSVKLEPWVIHDIRRTGRTGLSALPVTDMVRELVIAHARPGLHQVYDQYAYLDEKRHALELWATRLRSIVEPAPPNVVALSAARS